jgi:RNA-dependent RNA polymerase
MEVFMRGVPYTISEKQLVRRFAEILHGDEYREFSPDTLINFRVRLNRNQRGQRFRNGFLSLPSVPAGQKFLLQYGGTEPLRNFNIGRIVFALGNNAIRADILGELRRMPYVDPDIIEAQERLIQEFESGVVKIRVVQFGWECRDLDGVFSAEHEAGYGRGYISFQDDPREIRIHMETEDRMYTNVAAIAFGQIQYISVGLVHHQPIIFFSLQRAPVYETEMSSLDARLAQLSLGDFSSRGYIRGPRRIRRTAFDPQHADVVAYTSLAIRLVCASGKDLQLFRSLCQTAGLADWVKRDPPQDEYREIFCRSNREDLAAWLEDLEWEVAFQVQLLTRRLYVDLVEILSLQNEIDTYYERHGSRPTSDLLRLFASQVRDLFYHDQDEEQVETVHQCFMRCKDELEKSKPKPIRVSRANDDIFDCYHVMVTPSTYRLEGPFPERLNRVIRKYIDHSECFVRVSFVDENQLQYRFDRDVDGTEFIQRHVGSKLRDLTIAGQRLEFLAYSQSALKEHSVWYIRPFFDIKAGHVVDAARVIKSLGNFHNLTFDPNMGYCPARYAARISQSFTATDSSVSMEVEEVILLDDIQRFGSCFTDGVGTISLELAKAIRGALYNKARRRRRPLVKPSAFQIRFQGAKGMLSVDYKLKGRSICLRPSMIKFEAPNSNDIEIAQAFDRPSRYYLNRPLIMLLEGLGVPYRVFEAYQNTAVKDAEDAIESLVRTARLLEGHGLGTSFRLPSVLLNIQQKLGVTRIQDPFYRRMQEFAIHHVLREMKHKARIPIPGGFILVGVADIHGYLGPRDIFACTRCPECRKDVFFEGPTLVSRSPTIHPGDVQVLNAIGRPPEGSPFEREALKNCIVFSTKGIFLASITGETVLMIYLGERAIPSFLGGGDLDGDTYNVWSPSCVCKCTERWTHLRSYPLLPRTANQEPGSYIAAEKKLVDHLCNMDDVKDFFVDYITSDVCVLPYTNQ